MSDPLPDPEAIQAQAPNRWGLGCGWGWDAGPQPQGRGAVCRDLPGTPLPGVSPGTYLAAPAELGLVVAGCLQATISQAAISINPSMTPEWALCVPEWPRGVPNLGTQHERLRRQP